MHNPQDNANELRYCGVTANKSDPPFWEGFLVSCEALLASRLGTSATADAVILLLTLPDFMVGLLISGGFNAALIPVLRQHAGSDRVFLTRRAGLVITVGFTVLALVLSMFVEQVIRVFIPVADFAALTGFIIGFKLSMVALPVAALIGVSASYLNASGRFAIPGVSVLVFNGIVWYLLSATFHQSR